VKLNIKKILRGFSRGYNIPLNYKQKQSPSTDQHYSESFKKISSRQSSAVKCITPEELGFNIYDRKTKDEINFTNPLVLGISLMIERSSTGNLEEKFPLRLLRDRVSGFSFEDEMFSYSIINDFIEKFGYTVADSYRLMLEIYPDKPGVEKFEIIVEHNLANGHDVIFALTGFSETIGKNLKSKSCTQREYDLIMKNRKFLSYYGNVYFYHNDFFYRI
jgi:hypothetical protein